MAWMMVFPAPLEGLTGVSETEAAAVCLEHCGDDGPDKTACFDEDCPLFALEVQRCHEMIGDAERLKEGHRQRRDMIGGVPAHLLLAQPWMYM
jgi:hypothetical protein